MIKFSLDPHQQEVNEILTFFVSNFLWQCGHVWSIMVLQFNPSTKNDEAKNAGFILKL